MEIATQWESTYALWRRAQNIVLGQDSRRSRMFYVNYFAPILAAAIAWAIFISDIVANRRFDAAFGWASGLTFYRVWIWLARERAFKRLYRESRPEGQTRPNTLIFSDTMIRCTSPGLGSSEIEWAAISKAVWDKELLVLFITPTRFMILPQAAIPAGSGQQLADLVESKVQKIIHAD